MDNWTPFASTAGGLIIGLAVSLLLVANGRIAGISGIVGGALRARAGDFGWRVAFVLGLLSGGAVMAAQTPERFAVDLCQVGLEPTAKTPRAAKLRQAKAEAEASGKPASPLARSWRLPGGLGVPPVCWTV